MLSQPRVGSGVIHVKKILLAALAALSLSGCILDDDFWEDGYDSSYDYPSGDDCDCDDGEY